MFASPGTEKPSKIAFTCFRAKFNFYTIPQIKLESRISAFCSREDSARQSSKQIIEIPFLYFLLTFANASHLDANSRRIITTTLFRVILNKYPKAASKLRTKTVHPIFETKKGKLYQGRCEDILSSASGVRLKGKVQLIFTSPPFPLNEKKRYGNLKGEAYLEWLKHFGPIFAEMLTESGSIVMEVGNAWEPGSPVQSILPYRSLLGFLETGKLKLCQEITYYNPARLPSPAQWVTIERIRLKDATTKIWWMAKTDKPKADNRKVLRPYSESMKKLLKRGTYNSGKRPSQHEISEKSFLKDNAGAIAPNLLEISNTHNHLKYQSFCKCWAIAPHPARMPEGIAEFFIKFLTDKGDLVMDPFSGSNTTGFSAEKLGRRWVSIEALPLYAAASVSHFNGKKAAQLVKGALRNTK